jgi:hypothetical protein
MGYKNMMKYIATIFGAVLMTSTVLGATVTNTAKWNVPWGDRWRLRAEETLDSYEDAINLTSTLASNKVWIGSAAGEPAAQNLSGLFTITPAGVASAETTGPAVTSIATTAVTVLTGGSVASEIDVLDSITPAVAAAVTAVGAIQTDDVVTEYGSPTSDTFVKDYASPTTVTVITNGILQAIAGPFYDNTSAVITNSAGDEIAQIITNVVFETGSVLSALGSATTASALTGLGAATTIPAVTNLAASTTADFVNSITSNVVQAAKTLSTTTDDVIDSVTPTTATFAKP